MQLTELTLPEAEKKIKRYRRVEQDNMHYLFPRARERIAVLCDVEAVVECGDGVEYAYVFTAFPPSALTEGYPALLLDIVIAPRKNIYLLFYPPAVAALQEATSLLLLATPIPEWLSDGDEMDFMTVFALLKSGFLGINLREQKIMHDLRQFGYAVLAADLLAQALKKATGQ